MTLRSRTALVSHVLYSTRRELPKPRHQEEVCVSTFGGGWT